MFYKIVLIVIAIVIVTIVGGVGYFYFGVYGKTTHTKSGEAFVVASGEGVKTIGKNLYEQGSIKDRFLFETEVWLRGNEKEFIAGTYDLPQSVSIAEIVKMLTTSSKRQQNSITIPEGLSNAEIAQIWEKEKFGMASDFLAKANVTDSRTILSGTQYDFLAGKPSGATLEGYLYPDTYYLFADAKPEELIKKMLDNFEKKTGDLRADAVTKGKKLHDILILASVVEREVPKTSERPVIAGIFQNRLNIGMALQSDATVNYITGKYRLRPTLDDLQVDSLYNTYKYRGLPPGPIGNPSPSSMKAVLDPQPTEYFFFLSKPSGETVFSKTLDEHNVNKAKYLK